MACPSTEDLIALADRTLRNGRRQAAETHLARCPRCSAMVETLRRVAEVALPAFAAGNVACPGIRSWQEFVQGRGDAGVLTAHLAACDRCVQLVAALQDVAVEAAGGAAETRAARSLRKTPRRLAAVRPPPRGSWWPAIAAAALVGVGVVWLVARPRPPQSARPAGDVARAVDPEPGGPEVVAAPVERPEARVPAVADVPPPSVVPPEPVAEEPAPVVAAAPPPEPAPVPSVVPPPEAAVQGGVAVNDPPAPVAPVAVPAPAVTAAAVARIERTAGGVRIGPGGGGETSEAQAGREILAGQELRVDPGGSAVVAYADGTRIELRSGAAVAFGGGGPSKEVRLGVGAIYADVAKQPRGAEMLFGTPEAELRILGTRFELSSGGGASRLEVDEGLVQFTRTGDGHTIRVKGGTFAAAAAGPPPVARPIPFGANLLVDAGFEADGREWEGAKAEGRAVVRGTAHAGAKCLQMGGMGRGDLTAFQGVPVMPGSILLAGGWVRTAGPGAQASITVVWLNREGRPVGESAIGGGSGTRGWSHVWARAVAPAGTVRARLRLSAVTGEAGRGGAWFDDVYLKRRE